MDVVQKHNPRAARLQPADGARRDLAGVDMRPVVGHDVMTLERLDVVADDWTHINAGEIARRAVSRLEARGKGVLLLHDIHAATRRSLAGDPPGTEGARLQDRSRGAGGAGPAEDRDHARAMGGARGAGARTLAARGRHRYGDVRAGIDGAEPGELRRCRSFRPGGRVFLAPGFDQAPPHPGEVPPPPVAPWPRPNYSAPTAAGLVRGPRGAELSVRACVRWPAPGHDRRARSGTGCVFAGEWGQGEGFQPAGPARHVPVRGLPRTASPPRLFGHQL